MEETALINPIEKIVHHSSEKLISKLREVTLLKAPETKVYKDATIELAKLPIAQLSPPQRYVQARQIRLLQELNFALQEHHYDLLELEGYLEVWFQGNSNPVGIIPPIVEESIEKDTSRHWIICDGMHRCYLARACFTPPQVVKISNIPYPYYAYPNPNGWGDVSLIHEETSGILKKFHRIADNKSLYRNFVPQFGNLSVPRGKV